MQLEPKKEDAQKVTRIGELDFGPSQSQWKEQRIRRRREMDAEAAIYEPAECTKESCLPDGFYLAMDTVLRRLRESINGSR